MRKFYSLLMGVAVHGSALALTTISLRDNANVSIRLSNANYNRLVVKNDKITQAHFPEGVMVIQNEEDGSLYMMVTKGEPFTLFLTTEHGHHFSATVESENALGETVEFVPQQVVEPIRSLKPALPESAVANLMSAIMSQKKLSGFEVKHHYGKAIRLKQGLVLLPKLTYQGLRFNGEVFELYNGSAKTVEVKETWFADPSVKAIALSKTLLMPKARALVYRVVEHVHG